MCVFLQYMHMHKANAAWQGTKDILSQNPRSLASFFPFTCSIFLPLFSKDRLYYAPLQSVPSRNATATVTNTSTGQPESRPIHFFSIDNEFEYYNFYLDFGPFNLGHLYQFCRKLNEKLDDSRLSNHVICYYSSAAATNRTNAAYLICAWQVLYMNKTPEEAFAGFNGGKGVSSPPRSVMTGVDDLLTPIPFHDATQFVCSYDLTVLDCIRGLAKARAYGFFDFSSFDLKEYQYFEQVEVRENWMNDCNSFRIFTTLQVKLTPLFQSPHFF